MNLLKQTSWAKKRKIMLSAMVSSTLLLGMTGISYADEQTGEYSFDQTVVTANRVPTKISETGSNVTVITHEQIENRHYNNLIDALRDVNGVVVMQQGFPGGEQYVRLDGDERVLVMIDGRRLNLSKLPGSMGKGATCDLSSIAALDNVERIEIVKGPSSALYGSDAVGGVINIITRKGNANRSLVESSLNSWGGKQYKFVNEGSKGDLSWVMTAGKTDEKHYSYKNFKTGQVETMNNSADKQNNVTFRLDKEIDPTRSLTFNFEHLDDHKGQPYLPNGWVITNSWGSTTQYQKSYLDNLSNNWAVTYNFNKNENNEGYLRLYQNFNQYNSWNWSNAAWSNYKYENKETGGQWQSTWKLAADNTLVGGVDWRQTKITYPGVYTDKNITNTAVFLEDRIKLDNRWTFSPSIREDHHSMFGGKMTRHAMVNDQLDESTNVYASWGEVFNAPDADRLFWPYDSSMYYTGNPNLKPETGHTTTIGINKKIGQDGMLKVSAYKSELTDAIGTITLPNWMSMPMNVGRQHKEGIDIDYSAKLSPTWSYSAGYTYTKVENKDATAQAYSTELRTVDPNGYKFSLNYKQNPWDVELMGRGATARSTQWFTSSSYWIVDLAANYQINPSTLCYLKVNNLTNQAYELYGYQAPYQGGFPMPARSYQLGVKYQF
jgi:vitamin B12 transporter